MNFHKKLFTKYKVVADPKTYLKDGRLLIVAPLYGAAYLPKHLDEKGTLTHAVVTPADSWEPQVLCRKVKPEHVMEDETVWEDGPPTCPRCRPKWEKLKKEEVNASKELVTWLPKYKQDDFEVGLGERSLNADAVKFSGYRIVPPEDLTFDFNEDDLTPILHDESRPSGWAKKLDPKKRLKALKEHHGRDYSHAWKGDHFELAPVIVIGEPVADGIGRVQLCWALGVEVKIAEWDYK